MTAERAERRTTDTPVQRAPRRGIDISALALRYATAIRIAYLVCVAIATLLKLGFDPALPHALARLQRALDPTLNFRDVVDAARNIALFVGWGATSVLTSPAPTRGRDVLVATAWGMAASLTVESAQLFSSYRMASIADVATNTAGSLLGALLLWILERRAASDMRRGTLTGIPGWVPAGALLMAALGQTFAPSSRPTMAIAWASSPFERARTVAAAPALDVSRSALLSDVAIWLAVGLFVALAISDRAGTVRLRQFGAWLVLAPAGLALMHLGRSMAGLQREALAWQIQAAAGVIGLGLGFALLPRWRRSVAARSTRALQLGIVASAIGAAVAWSPAGWAARVGAPLVTWQQFVPMMSLFQRQDLSSVFLVLQKAGIGAAVGACLAARTRMGEPRPGVRAAVAWAAVVEIGQVLVPGRYPDVTDILITSAAAALVAILVERADRGARISEPNPASDLNGRPTAGSF